MAVNLSFIGGAGWQFFTDDGVPLSGGKIYTYAAGTTTPLATYTSRSATTANANPIILDAAGRTPQQIWATEGQLYKYVVRDANDVLIRTWDNIGGSVVASDLAQGLAASNGATLVGLTGFKNQIGTVDNLADATGADWIGYTSVGTIAAPATARSIQDKLRDFVSVKDFGAVGDGITDDTAAFQRAYNALSASRTSPPALTTNRGVGTIFVPKGKYLINGTVTIDAAYGLRFVGEGCTVSAIVTTVDTGNLFSATSYIYLAFEEMGFYHSTTSVRSTWTRTCFALSGLNGGREFHLHRCETVKFAYIVRNVTNANGDTNTAFGCTFNNFDVFYYARNSQGVVNLFSCCTWFGETSAVFDISGFGYTHVDTANVVQSGAFFKFAAGNAGAASQYYITNAKLEFWPQTSPPSGTTQIVAMEESAVNSAYMRFEQCAISSGSGPDPTIYQFDMLGSGYSLDVNGGNFGSCRVRTKARTAQSDFNQWWIRFANMLIPPSTTITRVSTASGVHVPVTFENCRGLPNITLLGDGTSGNLKFVPPTPNVSYKNAAGYVVNGLSTQHDFIVSGQLVSVDEITVTFTERIGLTTCTISAYADAALTVPIVTGVAVTGGTSTVPIQYRLTIPANTFTSDGVYVVVAHLNASGGAKGQVYVKTTSC